MIVGDSLPVQALRFSAIVRAGLFYVFWMALIDFVPLGTIGGVDWVTSPRALYGEVFGRTVGLALLVGFVAVVSGSLYMVCRITCPAPSKKERSLARWLSLPLAVVFVVMPWAFAALAITSAIR